MEDPAVEEEAGMCTSSSSSSAELTGLELTPEEMDKLTGGDPGMVKKVRDFQDMFKQEGVTAGPIQWKELLSRSTPERSGRNFSKSPSKSKTPRKTFKQMVQEEEAREKMMLGDTGRKKTIDDFEFKPSSSKKQQSHTGRTFTFIVLTALVVLFGIGMMWFVNNGESPTSNSFGPEKGSWEHAHKKLLSEIQSLRKVFPSQTQDTLLHILSAINSTLARQQPKQPSSLVILVPPNLSQSSFSQCFTRKLAKLTNNIFSEMNATTAPSEFEIDSKYFEKYGQDITLIHSQLHHYFGSGGRSIVVKDVEKIRQEKHLLLFHGLCDNFHAPEKRATLFFIVPVPQAVFTAKKWSNERASELSYEILDNAWKSTTNDDSRPAIISRVAASVVLLNNGDTCS